MKFDITNRMPAVDEAIARTTNPRHLAILENYRRHAILEVCGMWEEIVAPDMMVRHPVYRFHTMKGLTVLDGMEEVSRMYKSLVDSGTTVIYHTDETIAVHDEGFLTEYVCHRFFPGAALIAEGVEGIDDPEAMYLSSHTQIMVWPYDENCLLKEERVYRGSDRKIRKCRPEEVITVDECREKLLPFLKPVEAYRYKPDSA